MDRLTSSEKQTNYATNPLFSKQHLMIPTSPSFLQGPGPCQPCPAPVTRHLGTRLPKTASGPIVLSVPSPQFLPQKVHNSMFLSAIKTGPLNSRCNNMEFWVTTEKTDLIFIWVNNHFCLKDATYEASLLSNGTAAHTAIYKQCFKLLQSCLVGKLPCETEENFLWNQFVTWSIWRRDVFVWVA